MLDGLSHELNGAVIRAIHSAEAIQESGFATSGGAHECHSFARADEQGDAPQDRSLRGGCSDPGDSENTRFPGRGGRRSHLDQQPNRSCGSGNRDGNWMGIPTTAPLGESGGRAGRGWSRVSLRGLTGYWG